MPPCSAGTTEVPAPLEDLGALTTLRDASFSGLPSQILASVSYPLMCHHAILISMSSLYRREYHRTDFGLFEGVCRAPQRILRTVLGPSSALRLVRRLGEAA